MQKLVSEIISKGVIVRQESAIIGVVENVVIDPANGNLLGLLIREAFGKQNLKAIAAKDILGINERFVLVSSYKATGEIDDIVRIKNALDQGISIPKNKVYTMSNIYLGKVKDYTIDMVSYKISRLYVQPRALQRLAKELIIDGKCIVKIEKKRITVDDTCTKVKERRSLEIRATTKDPAV